MTRVLALDIASHLGFAFGTEAGVFEHGSYKLPATGHDIGKFLFAYRNWLSRGISVYQPDEIVFEMPVLPDITNLATLRKLYSLCGLTELIAQDHRKLVSEANLTDIRMHFLGRARAPKEVHKADRRKWIKAHTMTRCRELGFRPDDDNDADALALFSFFMSRRDPAFVLRGVGEAVAA